MTRDQTDSRNDFRTDTPRERRRDDDAMQPVDAILEQIDGSGFDEQPWLWRDRWAD